MTIKGLLLSASGRELAFIGRDKKGCLSMLPADMSNNNCLRAFFSPHEDKKRAIV